MGMWPGKQGEAFCPWTGLEKKIKHNENWKLWGHDKERGNAPETWGHPKIDGLSMKVKVTQLHLTLCDLMDYTVQGILQARILKWLAFSFSRGSSQPRDQAWVSDIAGRFFTSLATRKAQEYWTGQPIPSPADLPDPGIELGVSCIAGGFFTNGAISEVLSMKE